MNKTKIAFSIGIALAVLAVLTAPAMGYGSEAWLVPEDSTGEYGEADVLVYFNFTESVGETVSGQDDIYYDKNCVNIVTIDQSMSAFNWNTHNWFNDSYHGGGWRPWLSPTHTCVRIQWENPSPIAPGSYTYAVLTLRCNCSSGCGSDLLHGYNEMNNEMGDPITGGYIYYDGTYTCTAPPETFTKSLVNGWNLISLPLTPLNNSTSAVLGNDTMDYDAVYRYNATSKQFEDVTTGTMDPGIGYFVNVTTNGTWSYEGTPYTSMSVDLKQGLNMVGWLNCSKLISGNLTSIDDNFSYVASWNATAALPSFETFNPVAPDIFNDFDMMERGTGYFISAKAGDTLEENCP